MKKDKPSKIDLAHLIGPVRTYDAHITLEPMSDTKIKIHYQFVSTLFGKALIASSKNGVCYFGFVVSDKKVSLQECMKRFPEATFQEQPDKAQTIFLTRVTQSKSNTSLTLHIIGTPFQLKTWNALLKISRGKFATYRSIAKFIKHPNAYRAVGTAVGMNPVCLIIPCHRVVQASGILGNYHWGTDRKAMMIEREK